MTAEAHESATVDTLRIQLDHLAEELVKIGRRVPEKEDTGVQRVRVDDLAKRVKDELQAMDIARRKRLRVQLLSWGTGLGVFLAAAMTAFVQYLPKSPPAQRVEEVRDTVETQTEALEKAVEQNRRDVSRANRNLRRVGEAVIVVGDENAEATEYLSDKLDAMSKKAREVLPPASFVRRRAVRHRSVDQRVDDLFSEQEQGP